MTKKTSDTDQDLDALLQDLSFEPPSTHSAHRVAHQAPAGLQQRILASLRQEQQAKPTTTTNTDTNTDAGELTEPAILSWLFSPWRALGASVATLLFGVVLGSSTAATELYTAALEPTDYPDNDQLLVISSLDDDFTNILGDELIQDWGTTNSATQNLRGNTP